MSARTTVAISHIITSAVGSELGGLWYNTIPPYVTSFEKTGLNAANIFFQYLRVKPRLEGRFFFQIFFYEMDAHLLALSSGAVVSSGEL